MHPELELASLCGLGRLEDKIQVSKVNGVLK
jgi:hypothetical protein